MKIKHPYLRFIEGDGAAETQPGAELVGEKGPELVRITDEFKAPASQADLDRIVESRLARERAKFADYDSLKEKAQQFDTLSNASKTDQERAVEDARREERERVAAEAIPRVVRAEFKAAAKGVITDEALNALIEDLDLSKYVTESGDVDEDKVSKKISAIASATGSKHQPRDLGQGKRDNVKSSGVGAGADLFASTRK